MDRAKLEEAIYWARHNAGLRELNAAACDLIDALADAAEAGIAREWQPIETAPKDGTWVLCCDERTGEIRVAVRKLFFEKTGRYEWFRSDEHCPGHTWSLEPTHWQHLPSPPLQQGRGE